MGGGGERGGSGRRVGKEEGVGCEDSNPFNHLLASRVVERPRAGTRTADVSVAFSGLVRKFRVFIYRDENRRHCVRVRPTHDPSKRKRKNKKNIYMYMPQRICDSLTDEKY